MNKRIAVPQRFLYNIDTWLSSLTPISYSFQISPTKHDTNMTTVCIGDVHADPRGFATALFISSCIDKEGNWIGRNKRVILQGDILDGKERIGKNPTITPWDEIVCLRMIFELKQEAQSQDSDIIWVLGNHDIAAPMGQDTYLNTSHSKAYQPKGRQWWFRPGGGILSHYMARCSVICGKYGNLLVSHAGIKKSHIPMCIDDENGNKATISMRMWLLNKTITPYFQYWYHQDGPLMHRTYDIQPGSSISDTVKQELLDVSKLTNTTIQTIGHNFRPGVQKINVGNSLLFLVDTGISRSFGSDTTVQVLVIDQNKDTYGVFSVSPQ